MKTEDRAIRQHVTLSEATSEVAKSKGPHRTVSAQFVKRRLVDSGDLSTRSRTHSLKVTWDECAVGP